jgi:hypothetical protein
MMAWEYKILPIVQQDRSELNEFVEQSLVLDAMGMAGWELITIYKECFIFKRHAEVS